MDENIKLIQDVIGRVLESGSDLSQPMDVEFFIETPNEPVGQSLEAFLNESGYQVSLYYDKDYKEWTIYCVKPMLLSVETIINEEEILTEVANIYGCKYDGFQTAGNS